MESVMSKFSVVAALAVVVAGAHVVRAQTPRDTSAHRFAGRGGRAGFGMMQDRALFKNITLTDAQKTQLGQIRKSESASMSAGAGTARTEYEQMRQARQSGDTATANRLMAQQRAQMEQRFASHVAAVRNVLTPDQQKQLDANVADMKQHAGQFGRGPGRLGAQRPPAN
jgi:periplasmic protein CpxP/Spy